MKFTWKRIFGMIGVIWGGGVAISGVFRDVNTNNPGYAAGQYTGFALGGLLFGVGLYYVIKG
jgi:hypothetical protein